MTAGIPLFNRRTAILACIASLAMIPATAMAETAMIKRGAYVSELQNLFVAFLARDLATGKEYVLENSDLDGRHAPWSSFKIPNLIIALETGAAPSLDAWRDWDPVRRPALSYWPKGWREGQTLGAAFARSSAWYFQDLALVIGGPAYRARLSAWGYGNANVPDRSDDFWLGKSLQVSVREKVGFLANLLNGKLSVSSRSISALDTASFAGKATGMTLHGKTGSGPDDLANLDGTFSGWYAGYLRRKDAAPVVFALHVSAPSFTALRDFRKAFSVRMLEAAGFVPAGALQGQ